MTAPDPGDFERSVFVNCPFDQDYVELLRPLLFTIAYLGFKPRIALERFDSLEVRVDKICELIQTAMLSSVSCPFRSACSWPWDRHRSRRGWH